MGRRRVQKRRQQGSPELHRAAGRLVALVLAGMLALVAALVALHRTQIADLNAEGLRVSGEGRADASQVVDPAHFEDPGIREGYAIAQRIPETLNQLYCWCGCIDTGLHRSALECFESLHGANCTICLKTARVAWAMTQQGTTDPAEIQRALDRRHDPLG